MDRIYTVFTKRYIKDEVNFNIHMSFINEEDAREYVLNQMNNDFDMGGKLRSLEREFTMFSRIYFPKDNKQWDEECFIEYHCQINLLIGKDKTDAKL